MIIEFPTHKYATSQRWEDRTLRRGVELPMTICLPVEFEYYLGRYKHVYRIDKSHSDFSWVLTVDDGTWGWDQRGFYCQTLLLCRNGTLADALERAKKLLPEEKAFFVGEAYTMDREADDDLFEEWMDSL